MSPEENKAPEEPEAQMYENQPFSRAVMNTKSSWYDKVKLSVNQLDWIIRIAVAALVIVFILIVLEATGIFKL